MVTGNIMGDLKYARDLAENGKQSPLIGGKIGLMWGVLLTGIFFFQWGVLSNIFSFSANSLIYFWFSFLIIGGIGSAILGKKASNLSGANSVNNRIDSMVWMMFSAMMTTLFIGISLNIAFTSNSPVLFSLMLPVGFSGQGLAYALVAHFSCFKWMKLAAAANFLVSIICFASYGSTSIYLIGAIGILFTVVVPSIITIRLEPKNVD